MQVIIYQYNYNPSISRFVTLQFPDMMRSESTKVIDMPERLPIVKDPRRYPAVSPKRGLRKRGVLGIIEHIPVVSFEAPLAFLPSRQNRQSSLRFLSSRSASIPLRETTRGLSLVLESRMERILQRLNDDDPSE